MTFDTLDLLDYDRSKLTACDRCVLNCLHPHLMQAKENTLNCSEIQQIFLQFKQALDQGGVISLTIDGQVKFMTPRAAQLLSQYYASQDSQALPDTLIHWFKHQILHLDLDQESFPSLPLKIEQAERQLTIRLVADRSRDQYLLLLEEQALPSFSVDALELLGLTQREAEVLYWIAKDKGNAGIARVLGCCEGTVRKHLENLYKKLGVHTRMGAVMTALERLGLLQA